MLDKNQDKLFEYAFGDLDAHEAQIFEAGLLKDEVSAEEVKFLQSIKGDLASFRDIPEMQYSKERLRDAILGQGLKPSKPAFPWLNWVLAPGALACTFALGFILMNGTSRKDPVIIGGPITADASPKFGGSKLPVDELKKPIASTSVATNTDKGNGFPGVSDSHWASEGSDGKSHSGRVRSDVELVSYSRKPHSPKKASSPEHAIGAVLAMNVAKEISADPSAVVASVASMSGNVGREDSYKDMTETMAPKGDGGSSEATMIMINKDQDSGVGAPVATEVNDTKNVIVGG